MLFVCELCGGSNIERVSDGFKCTNCGCKYSTEHAQSLLTNFNHSAYNAQITQYLDIASTALDSKNGQEAYSYAEKVLQLSPSMPAAWYIKMRSIEYIATIGNPKIEEVVSCSRQVIKTIIMNEDAVYVDSTYTYLLVRATQLLSIATNLASDTTMIQNLTNSVMQVNPRNVTAQVVASDGGNLTMMERLADGALSLKKEVPIGIIANTPKYIDLVRKIANWYIVYCNAYVSRITIYSAYLNDANLAARRQKIADLKLGLPEEISTTIPSDIDSGKRRAEKNNGCYIATCIYGSYDCPQVWTLRRFRDYTLAETWYGRTFIKIYYAISPTLVRWFGTTRWFHKLGESFLTLLIDNLHSKGIESTPYDDRQWKI